MGAIRILPPEVANQIAAGEVVERPASVVKELVENALDAGASSIDLRLQGGGADLIEVADNGCGMDREDAILAIRRHATSKLGRLADLEAIRSFGFRGEALPSIASISRLVLTTSTGASGGGVRLRVEGGRLVVTEPAARPRGTSVLVEALFYNAPARRKFLRAPATESAHVLEAVARLAAAHPAISFRVTAADRPLLHWPGGAGLSERLAQILGAEEAGALRPIDLREGPRRVIGAASGPGLHRASPRDAHFYVNERPVRDRRLQHAVRQAYLSLLPGGRFPVVFLFLDLPPEEVDVNVHPAKSEVRFRNAGAVHDLVVAALAAALRAPARATAMARGDAEPAGGATLSEPSSDRGWAPAPGPGGAMAAPPADVGREPPAPEPVRQPAPLFASEIVTLAQFRDTYILAAAPDGIVMLDQHAAHERILYERLLDDACAMRVERQRLLFPLVLDVTARQLLAFEQAFALLQELGFVIAPFGASALRVEEVPASIPPGAAESLVRDLLAELPGQGSPAPLEDLRHRIAALAACHASVRAGEALPIESMRRIIRDLGHVRRPETCPHGRPTILRLPLDRIEREFRRR
jgi:DNA mismatch repair protein MutL